MPAVPSAHHDRRVVGYSALAVAALATLIAFLTASGFFDETSCLRADGIYDDATGGCHVSAGVAHIAPSERPLVYFVWMGTVAVCTLIAWLMLHHRSRRARGRRKQSRARKPVITAATNPPHRSRNRHRGRGTSKREAPPERQVEDDQHGNER